MPDPTDILGNNAEGDLAPPAEQAPAPAYDPAAFAARAHQIETEVLPQMHDRIMAGIDNPTVKAHAEMTWTRWQAQTVARLRVDVARENANALGIGIGHTLSTLSNTDIHDESEITTGLSTWDSTIKMITAAHPEFAGLGKQIDEAGRAKYVDSALRTLALNNPQAAAKALSSGRYDNILATGDRPKLEKYIQTAGRGAVDDQLRTIHLHNAIQKENSDNAELEFWHKNAVVLPDGRVTFKPGAFQEAMKAPFTPGALNRQMRNLDEGALRLKSYTDQGVYGSLIRDAQNNPGPAVLQRAQNANAARLLAPKELITVATLNKQAADPRVKDLMTKAKGLIPMALFNLPQPSSYEQANAVNHAESALYRRIEHGTAAGIPMIRQLDPNDVDYVYGKDPKAAIAADSAGPPAQPDLRLNNMQQRMSRAADDFIQITDAVRQSHSPEETVATAERVLGIKLNVADVRSGRWCANSTNAVLEHEGIKGTGSDLADSFLKWGFEVGIADVQKGDVFYVPPHHAGYTGHVGIVFSPPEMRGGKLQVRVASSTGDQWLPVQGMQFRAPNPSVDTIFAGRTGPNIGTWQWLMEKGAEVGTAIMQHLPAMEETP